jgi:hypothetical protein
MMKRPLALVGVVAFASVLAAQAPLPEALRAERRVYLEQGAGIDRTTIDRAAKEIQKYKPRRLELVADKDHADLIVALSDVSTGPGGVLFMPITGLGLVGVPVRDTTYRLTVRRTTDEELLWDDHRVGDVSRLVKDFLKRLTKDAETRGEK